MPSETYHGDFAHMSSRRLLHAGILAATALTLAACGPDDPSAAPGTGGTTSAAPSGTGAPAASPSTPSDQGPGEDCSTPDPIEGHHHIHITAKPAGSTVKAQVAAFACDPNDGHYEGTGPATTYHFAAKVTARVTQGPGAYKTVTLAGLTQHINDCLTNATVEPPNYCAGNIYDIAVNSSFEITTISEVWHS